MNELDERKVTALTDLFSSFAKENPLLSSLARSLDLCIHMTFTRVFMPYIRYVDILFLLTHNTHTYDTVLRIVDFFYILAQSKLAEEEYIIEASLKRSLSWKVASSFFR